MPTYELTGAVWRYPGKGGWHFVTVPPDLADELAVRYADAHRPFGSLRVRASLGSSTWSTSLFKDTKSASYLLPVRADVRRRERIEDGGTATIRIELEDRRSDRALAARCDGAPVRARASRARAGWCRHARSLRSQGPSDGVQPGMRTYTTSIEIAAPPQDAFAFVADPLKLPVWAIGFAKAIEPDGDGWVVTLAGGERMPLRIESDPATGVVDYVMLPASDVAASAHTRVMPHAAGTLYAFSMHQTPDIPDEVFDAQVAELERELTVLKAHLETACPL